MKNTLLLTLVILTAATSGCRKYTGEKAAEQRRDWVESLNDSISAITAARQADSLRLDQLRSRLTEEIDEFTQVANAREVEPYYILKAFKGRYPLSSTGIAARMTASEQMELIAALSGARFNSIRVSSQAGSATSLTVPADQALNYTSGGLTTVAFSGAQADSIGMIVADSGEGAVKLEYLQNGAVAKAITLTPDQKAWVGKTWSVCGGHQEARRLENAMMISGRKIEILRLTIRQEEAKSGASNP